MMLRVTVAIVLVFLMAITVNCKVIVSSDSQQQIHAHVDGANKPRQLILQGLGKETSTPDFVRLVVMRLIYGLASSMGVEERLEGLFNGAFVPPNADGDFFGFGGLGGGGDDDSDGGALGGLLGLADLEGVVEGDGLFDDGGL